MLSGHIERTTRIIGKPQGYIGLSVRDEVILEKINGADTPCMVTAWFPTPDEVERIIAGAPIYLHVLGTAHPPVMLDVGAVPAPQEEPEQE